MGEEIRSKVLPKMAIKSKKLELLHHGRFCRLEGSSVTPTRIKQAMARGQETIYAAQIRRRSCIMY
ncbi:Protein of unknown function, partial [Gryllus bimaculatus]